MPSNADKLYLDINGLSKHLGSDVKYNERNYGAGLTYEKDIGKGYLASLIGGGYKNSNDRNSYYLAAGIAARKQFLNKMYLEAGIVAGGISGYGDSVTPAIMPMAGVGLKDVGKLRAMYAPKTDTNPSVLMMNLGIPFK